MTDEQLEELARSVEELKSAVKKNDPFLRGVLASRGWGSLACFAAATFTLFSLPAHFLSLRYGSFDAIPAPWKAAIWAALAAFMIAGTIWKILILRRTASEADRGAGIASIIRAIFGGAGLHMALPFLIATVAALTFAFYAGHPWLSAPSIAILVCFWCNSLASSSGRRDYYAIGWWSLISGVAGLFFVEKAPFLWLFIIYGGLCYIFAAETIAAAVLERRRADGKR